MAFLKIILSRRIFLGGITQFWLWISLPFNRAVASKVKQQVPQSTPYGSGGYGQNEYPGHTIYLPVIHGEEQ